MKLENNRVINTYNAEDYACVFRSSYLRCSVKKGVFRNFAKFKQVASSAKQGLGDNVVLRLMECLTPPVSFYLFMNHYFTSFRLFVCLPLELTTFEQEVCSTKIGYANTLSSGTNSCKKRNVATLNSAAHIKQKRCETCVAGQNDSSELYIASSESCQHSRNLFWNKVERKYIQEQQPNQFHCYNQNMGFVKRMAQNVAKHRIGIRMKKWWWYPFV